MEKQDKKPAFQLLMLIATPKLADAAAELFKKGSLPIQYRFNAQGTASSEMMDMLGLGSIDKGVLISMMPKSFSDVMMEKLHTELKLDTENSGIAFTIPLTGANNLILRMLSKNNEEIIGKEENVMTEAKYTLIASIVDRGFSEDVMNAARTEGAKGGTVFHSRRIGNEEAMGFWGLSVAEEKEIVMILAPVTDKVSIMKAISEKCGMGSEAKGIVLSLPIDSAIGI